MLDMPIVMAPLVALVLGVCAIPAVRRIALAHGFADKPDQRRKFHGAPIALGGGIVVWLATWLGWSASQASLSPRAGEGSNAVWFFAALGLASFLMLCLGLVDDRCGLQARYKLVGQFVPALILVGLGTRIDAWRFFGFELQLGVFAYPLTVFWILLIVNGFNLIDGMDGFCGSVSLIASLAIAFLAHRAGRTEDAALALAMAGSLAAFLGFNLPPAKIYLGDAGSMTVGLIISVLAIRSCGAGSKTAVLLLPMIGILMLPLLDVVTAAARRWLKRSSVFAPDRGHIHHCMTSRLGSVIASLILAVMLATAGAVGAVAAVTSEMGDSVAFFVIALSVGFLTCTRTFGATEWRLLLFRLSGALSQLSTTRLIRANGLGQECHLRGTRDWGGVWDSVVREAELSGVRRLELAIELAAAGELYHASWTAPAAARDEPHWSIVHTLYAGDTAAGTISASGSVTEYGSPYLDKVERLVRAVEHRLVCDDARLPAASTSPLAGINLPINSALT